MNDDTSVKDISFEANGSEDFTEKQFNILSNGFIHSRIYKNDRSRFSDFLNEFEKLIENKIDEFTGDKGNLKIYHSFVEIEIDFNLCKNCMKLLLNS